MRITVGDISVPVGVKEWTSNYDSSIVWKQVGTKHKGIDRGIASDKISAEVTIRGVDTVVPAIRAMVLSAANNSTPIIIDCEIFETIFGPEFNYSDFTYECLVSEDDNDLSDSASSTTVFSEWTFSVFPTCNMSERYLKDTGLFPNTLSINSAKRLDNGARILSSADSKNYLLGFGFSAPTCEIEYEGTLEDVAEAKTFLQKLRTNYFEFSAALVWPFNLGVTNVNVYCLDIDDNGPLDKTSQWHSFTVVYGYAGAAMSVWDGVTVTTPALVDGYYQIYDGATLAGFNALAVDNKKGRVTADFALNENYDNYETWGTIAPANFWSYKTTEAGSIAEFDGQGHSIYGLYGSGALLAGSVLGTNGIIKNIKILNFYKKDTSINHHNSVILTGLNCTPLNSIFNIIAMGTHDFGHIFDNSYRVGGIIKYLSANSANSNAHSLLSIIKFVNVNGCPIGCVAAQNGSSGGTLRNCGSICSADSGYFTRHGGVVGYNNAASYNNCWSSSHMAIQLNGATPIAIGPGSSFVNCYYDSTKLVGTAQGVAKTTAEIKTQAFVDLLNANLPAGCTPWKLGLDGYPTLDF